VGRVTAEDRRLALQLTVDLVPKLNLGENDIDGVFGKLYRLLAPTRRLAGAAWIDGVPYTFPPNGGIMASIPVAATVDNNTVTFVVSPQDDHQDPTADQLTVTSDDTAGVTGTLAVNDDTHGAVLTLNHVEGTVNVTFSDPSAPGVEDLVFAVTVGAGATSQLAGSATVA
jgi:hypothetical protein